jgi:hypothetical protein
MHFAPITVDRGLCIVLTFITGAALFAAEACSGGSEHPPVASVDDHAPRTAGISASKGGGGSPAPSGGDNGGDTAGDGTGGASSGSGGTSTSSSGATSEVNPGKGQIPPPPQTLSAAIDGG